MNHITNPVFRSLNRPLLLLGIDRRIFFVLLSASFALFNLTSALAPAIALFVALLIGARLAQKADPQFPWIVLSSRRFRARYDPAKFSATEETGGRPRGFA